MLEVEGASVPMKEGDAVFVEAGADHRFTAYEHLAVLVIFERGSGKRYRVSSRRDAVRAHRCSGTLVFAGGCGARRARAGTARRDRRSRRAARRYSSRAAPPVTSSATRAPGAPSARTST